MVYEYVGGTLMGSLVAGQALSFGIDEVVPAQEISEYRRSCSRLYGWNCVRTCIQNHLLRYFIMKNKTLRTVAVSVLWLISVSVLPGVQAQSAPSPREVAAFEGLHKAAHEGDVKTLLSLIKAGADIESRDNAGRTVLHVAAFASHETIVEALAEAGADMNALEFRAYDIVTIAAVANDVDMLDTALTLGASASNITSPYEGTALIAAAHLGHHQVVDRLIKSDAPLDHINNLEWTALIEAVILGDGGQDHQDTVRVLLAAGADQTIGDEQGVTPLEHAQLRSYTEMVEILEAQQPR